MGRLFSRAADCAIYINGKTVQSRPPLLVRQCHVISFSPLSLNRPEFTDDGNEKLKVTSTVSIPWFDCSITVIQIQILSSGSRAIQQWRH